MSVDGWNTVLVLGGIRSGKSAFAESLVDDAASVRYIATAVGGEDDPEWLERIEVHQRRRPQSWSTEETGADPQRLVEVFLDADPGETLLVDDLGGWVAALLDPARQPNDDQASVAALADAARACRARLVLVSPEVGLTLVATNPVGRAFTDALGTVNQSLAEVCDRVVLVVAGQPVWLKRETAVPPTLAADPVPAADSVPAAPAGPAAGPTPVSGAGHDAMTAATPPAPAEAALAAHDARLAAQRAQAAAQAAGETAHNEAARTEAARTEGARTEGARTEADGTAATATADALNAPTMILPVVDGAVVIEAGMDVPLPDQDAGPDAHDRLANLDVPGTGLGVLGQVVEFAATTQGTATPRAWGPVRVLVLHGTHAGGASAGADLEEAARRAAQAASGQGPLARLAAEAHVDVRVVPTPDAAPIEDGPALDADTVDEALRQGWALAAKAADDGMDAIVLGACSVGAETAATAVLAATSGAEPVAVLGRVLVPGGFIDDAAWMARCTAVRDAMHRIRHSPRGAKDVLAEVGGGDIAVATGVLLGAAARRIPVLIDGPVGISAGLVARDLATQTRHWCLLADHGGQPAVRQGADVLGLDPVFSLGLGLGEGANALAVLPLLRAAIGLAAALPVHPALSAGHEHEADDSYVASFDAPADAGGDPVGAPGA